MNRAWLALPLLLVALPPPVAGQSMVAPEWEPWADLLDVPPEELPDAIAERRGLQLPPPRCEDPAPPLADALALLGAAMGETNNASAEASTLNAGVSSGLAALVACIHAHLPHLPVHPPEAGEAPDALKAEWLAAVRDVWKAVQGVPTYLGTTTCVDLLCRVQLGGPGDDTHTQDAIILLDAGGNDLYLNNAGGATAASLVPVAVLRDEGAGADRYHPADSDLFGAPSAGGAYLGGVALLLDGGGNDHYRALGGAMGSAYAGAGFLVDAGGNDHYESPYANGSSAGQSQKAVMGAGVYGGTGALVDLAGDDTYTQEGVDSQGWGGAGGLGLLRDDAGNDAYTVRAAYTRNQDNTWSGVVSGVSIGVGEVGGVGLLLDGAGDDQTRCEGSVMWGCQGAGHWSGFGLLYDRTGNDQRYLAPHHAPSGQVEGGLGAGDLGGSGLFVDEAGNDAYHSDAVHSGGYGTEGAVGSFLDLAGTDTYAFARAPLIGTRGNGQTWVGEAGNVYSTGGSGKDA